jgi:hypothetical protein
MLLRASSLVILLHLNPLLFLLYDRYTGHDECYHSVYAIKFGMILLRVFFDLFFAC